MSDSVIQRFTSGQSVGVDVAAIERDLAALWRKASADTAVTRACSWNLVVPTETPAEKERAHALADALVLAVPSRMVVLDHRPNATGQEIQAFVTANCRLMPGGGKLLCTEEITIEARGEGGDHLASLLRALVVPDLPTAALFAGLPPVTPLVNELLEGVDRLVVDSRGGPLSRVATLDPRLSSRVADLNWLRLAPLRRVLATAFDPPADASMLFRLRRVTVECDGSFLPSARLILGWLAGRLAWGTPERASDQPTWTIPRAQGSLVAQVRTTARPPGLAAMIFEGEGTERVTVSLDGAGASVESGSTRRTVPHATRSDDELVVAVLGSRGSDRLYLAAVNRARELEA